MDFVQNELSDDPKEALVELLTGRLSNIRRKREALKTQIDQTNMIVEREQARNSDIASELQLIQGNLESLPRGDIRDKYNDALDIRSRLATMRGQLEKFESQHEYLEEEVDLLTQVLSQFQNVDFSEGDLVGEETESKSSINIVRIVQTQEDERQRLAGQMHDGPAQSLTNFILQAEICERLFNRDPERAAEELNNLKEVANFTFEKVRDFIFDLRPMMLDDLGVIPTVRRYVDSFREKNDIAVELDISGDERRLDKHREVMIFRSIQELITHGRDYATAANMKVHMDMGLDLIKVMVSDDGRGFDAESLLEKDPARLDSRSQALITLQEKFDLVGGMMSINSGDEGTVIRLELPTMG